MHKINTKKIGAVLLLLLQLSLIVIPGVNALILDGCVNESTWSLWFTDSGNPSYSIYYSSDETYAYIGVVTSSTQVGDNDLEFAFKALENDWVIKLSDVKGLRYAKSDDDGVPYYWGSGKLGLLEGVQLVQGVTDEKISYEISIEKELLGKYGEDFPNSFEIWVMVATGSDGQWIWSVIDVREGEVNFYPESRAGWWFILREDDEPVMTSEEIPSFHTPELPIGTVMSVILMLSAMIIATKRKPLSNL